MFNNLKKERKQKKKKADNLKKESKKEPIILRRDEVGTPRNKTQISTPATEGEVQLQNFTKYFQEHPRLHCLWEEKNCENNSLVWKENERSF